MLRHRGFTLIELLVVIAIIALLIGVLLPSLAGARDSARAMKASAAARSLMFAYHSYADSHAGMVMPRFLSALQASEGVYDEMGNRVYPPVSQRWVYRLGPNFDHVWPGTTHVGARAELLEDREAILSAPGGAFNWSYQVSVFPSFGLNQRYLGGDYRAESVINRQLHIRRLDQAMRPTDLLVFASARFVTGVQDIDGYLTVDHPPLDAVYDDDADTRSTTTAFGHLDARYGGKVLVGWLDGHVAQSEPNELSDRRLWADPAARRDDPNWEAD